jgi:hypothetical protein
VDAYSQLDLIRAYQLHEIFERQKIEPFKIQIGLNHPITPPNYNYELYNSCEKPLNQMLSIFPINTKVYHLPSNRTFNVFIDKNGNINPFTALLDFNRHNFKEC